MAHVPTPGDELAIFVIAQVFPNLRVLDGTRTPLAYLRLPGFREPPGHGPEISAFESYEAFLAAHCEAEGFLVNTTDADTAGEVLKRIRRDPVHRLKPVFLLHDSGPLSADLADGRARSIAEAESMLADFRRQTGRLCGLPPAAEDAVLLRYLALRPGKVLIPHRDWRHPRIYSYPLAALLMPGLGQHPETLAMLCKRGLLEPDDLVDRLRLCPECRTAQVGFIDVCPECHSLKIGEEPFLHCFTCGFVGPQPEFVQAGAIRCPRCQEPLRHIGVDYDRALEHWACASCRHLFEEPEIKARCGICLWSGATERLIARPIESLRLTEAGRRAALESSVPVARLSGPARYVTPAEFPEILDYHISLIGSNPSAVFGLLCFGIDGRGPDARIQAYRMTRSGKDLAEQLMERLRGSDIVTRSPEDVLWVLLPGTHAENTRRVLGRLRESLSPDLEELKHGLRSGCAVAPEELQADDTAEALMGRLYAQVLG